MDFLTSYKLPVAELIEKLTEWMTVTFVGLFNFLQVSGQNIMDFLNNFLNWINPLLIILIIGLIAYKISEKKLGITSFSILGLLFILNQGLWQDLMNTFSLVLIASVISVIIGIPFGIWTSKSDKVQSVIKPILDFMQTMPGFVYLIPAVAFFGIGVVPGIFASVIFAVPPTVRMTNLGIRSVPEELIEAADSYGSTGIQKLFKVELPIAKENILAGINQTLMLSLSMVVTASMIGAPGLGRGVLSALQRAQVGNGFVNGVSLVILAIIIDRFMQYTNKYFSKAVALSEDEKKKRIKKRKIILSLTAFILIFSGVYNTVGKAKDNKKEINLAYVEWDTEVASTNVIGQILKDQGFKVNIIPLDNSIMWQSLSSGESDAIVSAWLPNTHRAQFEKYQDKVENLGPNLNGAKVGLVVPEYMDVNSIEDLDNQANKTITAIEPGAGLTNNAFETIRSYSNLKDWVVKDSSSGAMTITLNKAIKEKKPIVITGWTPHWMFEKYNLKFLEDPKQTMGKPENINTVVRKGLKKDSPKAYKILDNFYWEDSDIQEVMLKVNRGESAEKAAKKWIKNHPEKVKKIIK